jgi:hypothetical protein
LKAESLDAVIKTKGFGKKLDIGQRRADEFLFIRPFAALAKARHISFK